MFKQDLIGRKAIPDRGRGKCKGPEARGDLLCLWTSNEATVAEADRK